jgi:putative spermidine/putrescine transport system substrate-binding protein
MLIPQTISRRAILGAAAALAAPAFVGRAHAAGKLVAAAFPGETEDTLRKVLTPALAKQGVTITFAPAYAHDQLGRTLASPGSSPFDALYVSPGQTAELVAHNLIEKVDPSKIPNWSKLAPAFQTEWGPIVNVEVAGIVYNPKKVPKPTGYRDLFENPAFFNKISLQGLDTNVATLAYVELAKIYGGSASNIEPAFEVLKKYLPKVGAIANNAKQNQTLFQQGEVDVFLSSTTTVARLKSLGLDAEFAKPETGCQALPICVHLTRGSANADAVYSYMNTMIDKSVQDVLKGPPLAYFPTNGEVELPPAVAAYVTRADIAKLVYPDWAEINPRRARWTEQFNKLVSNR